jgi:hypothetical protein
LDRQPMTLADSLTPRAFPMWRSVYCPYAFSANALALRLQSHSIGRSGCCTLRSLSDAAAGWMALGLPRLTKAGAPRPDETVLCPSSIPPPSSPSLIITYSVVLNG